jgi:hypothetical protein
MSMPRCDIEASIAMPTACDPRLIATSRRVLRQIRQYVLNHLKAAIAPLLHDSGFVKVTDRTKGIRGPTRPYRLYAFEDDRKLRGGMAIEDYRGFAEDGVITDAHGGGCVTTPWKQIPVEDLILLLAVAERVRDREMKDCPKEP